MARSIGVFVYPVKDLARAKTLYSKLLGVEPYVDEAYYVGFKVGDQEIGLDPNGHGQGMTAIATSRTSGRVCGCCWRRAHRHSRRSRMSAGGSWSHS